MVFPQLFSIWSWYPAQLQPKIPGYRA